MKKMDAEMLNPRVLRSGKVLERVEWNKPQRKKRKTNKPAESESTSAGAPSVDGAATLPLESKPPKEPEVEVDSKPEVEALVQKDAAEPLQNTDQQLSAGIILGESKSNNVEIGKIPDTLSVSSNNFSNKKSASTPRALRVTIKQERNGGEDDDPSCSIKPNLRLKPEQGRVSKNEGSPINHTQKSNDKKVPLKRGRKSKKYNLPVTSDAATTKEENRSATSTMADTIELLNTGSSQASDTEKPLKMATVAEEPLKEKVMVSIPICPNIFATIIKQERNDEGQEPIIQQQCCSNSNRYIKQERLRQGRASNNTGSTVDGAQEPIDMKPPLKRGRKPKKLDLPVMVKEEKTSAVTMADTIVILNSGTSNADDGGTVILETQQQPLHASESEELLGISNVAQIPPKDNTFVLQDSGIYSIFDMTETQHTCYLALRKPFQRLLVREWFYSNIDQCLLGRGNGVQDMETLLSSQLPALTTRRLNRPAWNYIREILRRWQLVQRQRRCSEKFFLDERMRLEQRREKVRFLQAHPMFEYLDDDLPADVPIGIQSGDSVVAQLNEPYGIFRGVVEKVDGPSPRSYTVRFEDPAIENQIVPDIHIASATPSLESKQEAEVDEIVIISENLSKQLEVFKDQLDEKEKLLNEMQYLRLGFGNIRNHFETHQTHALMQAYQRRYLEYIDDLQTTNSAIVRLMRTITRLGFNVDEALVDRQVVEIGQRLKDICNKAGNIPLGNNVLELTLRDLRGPPSRLKELQMYLQGNKFVR
ncbi:uncharacterized protein LOC118464019 isoform X2 [Anopheles albimanus]|uniref:uncharacterized protein LOC118464019 isoform X2 n=1 Tax=Anopheles albimanus TaxID=7167 RepID=UPI00163F2D6A|nr:uncharacterized protein LOC118464019 isoform X2 [Anopheles albimanus]